MRDWIDQWIKIKCRQIWIFGLYVYNIWCMIPINDILINREYVKLWINILKNYVSDISSFFL